jgi:site-specific recombinase XerD
MNNKSHHRSDSHSVNADALQIHASPFMAELRAAGYAANTFGAKRTALEQFLRWRHQRKSHPRDVTESEIEAFLAKVIKGDRSKRSVASRALYGFLEYLRRCKVVAPRASKDLGLKTALEVRYADFLRQEKGLAELSLKVYVPVARDLLKYLHEEHRATGLRRLNAPTLRAYLLQQTRDRSSQCARLLATSLRSFLRFLHAQGEIPNDLAAAIPTVRRWSQPGIPRTLTPVEVDRVLDTPDLKMATGRRDHAILLLLARLGLRSSEILSLELGDIRWRAGEILIRGKGSRRDLLPLPGDVGAAIARYLRSDRGVCPTPRVFLRTIAPRVPLTGPASIGHIVRRAMIEAKVQRPRQVAAHLFRHTLASRMLNRGADLREISQVLRHRALTSTEIYAKIDHGMLREVVRPWPKHGGAQ